MVMDHNTAHHLYELQQEGLNKLVRSNAFVIYDDDLAPRPSRLKLFMLRLRRLMQWFPGVPTAKSHPIR